MKKYISYSHTMPPAQCTTVCVGSHDSCMLNTSVVLSVNSPIYGMENIVSEDHSHSIF
jgi:hypothetical protein